MRRVWGWQYLIKCGLSPVTQLGPGCFPTKNTPNDTTLALVGAVPTAADPAAVLPKISQSWRDSSSSLYYINSPRTRQRRFHPQHRSNPRKAPHVTAVAMFKQAISTSTRALRSSSRFSAQTPIFRSQFAPAPLRAVSLAPRSRWYSDQAEPAAKKEGEAAGSSETKEAEAPVGVEAELKKKLEAKEKEAIDWKVRRQ